LKIEGSVSACIPRAVSRRARKWILQRASRRDQGRSMRIGPCRWLRAEEIVLRLRFLAATNSS
jgi:hypothetical protein